MNEELLAKAVEIRDETKENQNSATRVGRLFIDVINKLSPGYGYMGMATPSDSPAQTTQKCFYQASSPGTYVNFGALVVKEGEIAYLLWDGISWRKETYFDIVNDLITGGADKALSAEMGKELATEFKYKGVTFDMNTNRMVPELYITGLDKSKTYNIYQIDNGSAKRRVLIYDSNGSEPDIFVASATTTDFSKNILQIVGATNYPNISGFVVVNWDIVPEGLTNLFSVIQHEAVNNLANNPRIASEIQLGIARDDLNNKINGTIGDIGVIPSSSYFNGLYDVTSGKPGAPNDGVSVFSDIAYKVEGGASYRILGNIKSYLVEWFFFNLVEPDRLIHQINSLLP